MLAGTLSMYLIGVPWMISVLGAEDINASIAVISVNILPFIPVDIMKMILSVLLGYSIKKRIHFKN